MRQNIRGALLLALSACADDAPTPAVNPEPEPTGCVPTSPALQQEAGFFALDDQPLGPAFPQAKVRMFHAFQPAAEAPDCKPLMVIFQGGPIASMVTLWGGNTGAITLDPARTNGASFAPNPHSWTRFANLLYIDSPYAGFSYVKDAPGLFEVELDARAEAGSFVRALIAFLDAHPRLARVPVVLVGESYGGLRAQLMLHQILHFDGLPATEAAYARDIERTLRTALAAPAGELTAPKIGKHFSQVLIQPYMSDRQNLLELNPNESVELLADGIERTAVMERRVLEASTFRALMGTTLESMHAMYAHERLPGMVPNWHPRLREPHDLELATIYGVLPAEFRYFTSVAFMSTPLLTRGVQLDAVVTDVLHHVRTMITHATRDGVIDTEAFARVLTGELGLSGRREPLSARIEDLVLAYPDGERRIRFPRYDASGHPVAMHEPELLADDIRNWLLEAR